MSRIKFVLTLCFSVLLAGTLAPSVSAQSPSQQECEAAGGMFDRSQGTVTCTFTTTDPVGNGQPDNGQGKKQTTTTTTETSAKGNTTVEKRNSTTNDCKGPGNGDSSAQCP